MSASADVLARAVGETLERGTRNPRSSGPCRWRFELHNGKVAAGAARLDEGWLGLEVVPGLEDTAPWELLRLNGTLPGPAKLAVPPGRMPAGRRRAPRLRAELPVDDGIDLGARLGQVLEAFRQALGALDGVRRPTADTVPADGAHGAGNPDEWSALLAETGWSHAARSDGRVMVDLDVPGGFYQAALEELPGGSVRLAVPLPAGAISEPPVRSAVSLFLLSASWSIRLARAAAAEVGHREAVFFEAAFSSRPSATELDHALAACSLACGQVVRSVRALGDPRVARAYLAVLQESW